MYITKCFIYLIVSKYNMSVKVSVLNLYQYNYFALEIYRKSFRFKDDSF